MQDSSGSVTSRSLGLPRRQSHLEDIQSDSDSTTVDTSAMDRKEGVGKTRCLELLFFKKDFFLVFLYLYYLQYSKLLHLSPLRINENVDFDDDTIGRLHCFGSIFAHSESK